MYKMLFAGMYYHFIKVEGGQKLVVRSYFANVAVYAMTASHALFIFGAALLFFLDDMKGISWSSFLLSTMAISYLVFHYLYLHKEKYQNIVNAYYKSASKYRAWSLSYHILLISVFAVAALSLFFSVD